MPLQIQLKAYADAVNARLDQLLPRSSVVPVELHEAMRYSCLSRGKRLRPALCMASAEAVGAPAESVLDAACAIEMVHCFSLIHDDLPAIDDDDLRRGQPTCHKRFGEAIAILAGDALFSLAFEVLSHISLGAEVVRFRRNGAGEADDVRLRRTGGKNAPATGNDGVLRAVQVLTKATGSDGLVGGEVVDVLSEGVAIDIERLQYIHSRKTGALMAAACQIGAILGGGTPGEVESLGVFGQRVGLAFQIADDILNETSNPEKLGKAVGSDREREKATYTLLFGLEPARRLAEETTTQAKAALAGMRETGFLLELADFTVQRLH